MIRYFGRWLNFSVLSKSCDLKFKLTGIFNCKARPMGYLVRVTQMADTWTALLSVPGSTLRDYQMFVTFLFLPPYWVSTQWLSSSKWLPRGGGCSRCVNFCAMHSQCLPKTVMPRRSLGCAHADRPQPLSPSVGADVKRGGSMRSHNALGNVAFRQHDRPLRHEDAPHEGHRIWCHPNPPPSPTFCLMSAHELLAELLTSQYVTPIAYLSTSRHAQLSRKGACNLLSTWLPGFFTPLPLHTITMFCIPTPFFGARQHNCISGKIRVV